MNIPIIVKTGGPCSGKTTSLARTNDFLLSYGRTPLFVPEVATDLIRSNIIIGKTVDNEKFQELVLREQLARERVRLLAARHIKKAGGSPVIICDRGALDGLAYIDTKTFKKVAKKVGTNTAKLRERYLGVLHLRTAALGAEKFYTLENNAARHESLEEARTLDERTLQAWNGHHKLRVVPNEPGKSFDQKMERVTKEICAAIGIPVPIEIERAFDIKLPNLSNLPPYVEVEIVQHYLMAPKDEPSVGRRIRERTQDGFSVYVETKKRDLTDLTCVESERYITKNEFERLLEKRRDPRFRPIKKTRICFIWEHQYFELDIFHSPKLDCARLEIELTEEQQVIKLPPFLKIIKETRESNRDIAFLESYK